MLTQTSLSAIRALVFLGLNRRDTLWSPRSMAQHLGESPTYLAKVVRLLVRAGILTAHRGAAGGMLLNRPPETVTLLAIVEACQGTILGDFCSEAGDLSATCGFHQAAAELHQAIVGVLSRWTLADFLNRPGAVNCHAGSVRCWLEPRLGRFPPSPAAPLPKQETAGKAQGVEKRRRRSGITAR